MKILTPGMHGFVDYLIVVFLWSAPILFVLPEDIAGYVYLMGFAHLVFTMSTDFTSGMFRFISLSLHGIIEFVYSIGLITLAYTVLRYDERAKYFFLTYGIGLLVLFVVTDYTGTEQPTKRFRSPVRLRDPKTAL